MVPAGSRKIPRVPRYSGYHYASDVYKRQGLGCSPIKVARELGSERRETVRSLSIAVSYTHLDVYKRQIIMCLSFSSRVLRYKNLLCKTSVIQRITKKFQGIRIICLVTLFALTKQ